MNPKLLKLLFESGSSVPLVERIETLPYDELVEIDLANNYIENLFHVGGKFFVPVGVGSYRDLYRYANDFMVHPDDRDIHASLMNPDTIVECLAQSDTPGALGARFRYKLQDGGWRWVEQIVIGGAQHGLPENVVRFYVIDIQHSKEREMGQYSGGFLAVTGDRDELTGLLRAKAFFAKTAERLEAGGCDDWCMIALDIEHFKLLNDWSGREAGDYVLSEIGVRMSLGEDRSGGIAGYLEQDDFCLFVPYVEDRIHQLYADIAGIVASSGTTATFLPAFGVGKVEPGLTALDLYDNAALAQMHAKSDYRNRIRTFEPSMYQKTEEEYRMLAEFEDALTNRRLFYVLQPQCRASNGKVVGVEALARWRKSDGEMASPVDFVPVLEKYGFITDLDCYIWDMVCADVAAWRKSGHKSVPFSINISQVDFYTIDVAGYIAELLRKYDLPPSILKAEITESAYANDTSIVYETAQRLRDMGVMVLMDDFGSGYSSLNMLGSLNVDVVKLDAAFLQLEGDKRKGIHILESIVNMAKSLNMPIICEGVETREQMEFLDHLGCRYVQGFLFYQPMDPREFERLMQDGTLADDSGFITKPNDEFQMREFLDRNVYSDAMLNSILGAVCICSLRGDRVDIVRFNENFYELVNDARLINCLEGVQKRALPDDLPKLYEMLQGAVEDRMNGASALIGLNYRDDGTVARFHIHCYYLEDKGPSGKLFYMSLRDMTQIVELQSEIALFSRVSETTIVMMKRVEGKTRYTVAIHGLEDVIGLTAQELAQELEDRSFYKRVDAESAAEILDITHKTDGSAATFKHDFTMENTRGEHVKLRVRSDHIEDRMTGVRYILAFRQVSVA